MSFIKPLFAPILDIAFPRPEHPSYSKRSLYLRWRMGWLRVQLYYKPCVAIRYFLGLGPKVIWGPRVSFFSRVRLVGPGTIFIGADCIFDSCADLFTHSQNAVIKIGEKSFINGTRFGCQEKISIGRFCILADCRIMDTDFHSAAKNRLLSHASITTAPVIIEENVWISGGSAILKGVAIAKDSVVAFGSIVTKNIPAGKIYAGNPAKEISTVPTE